MSCPKCASGNQLEFSSEMIIHLGGLKNLDNSGVPIFPKLFICVSCGFAQFAVPEKELALLASHFSSGEQLTMAAVG